MDDNKQDEGAKLLEMMYAKRGYLLPYHRMLAGSDPQLLSTYDTLYTRLTLNERVLTLAEREVVWVALIATTRAPYAAFHFERAVKAGMDNDAISDSAALAAACEGFEALRFTQEAFPQWVPESRAMKRYAAIFEAARGKLEPAIAEVAAVVCFAAHRNKLGMRFHLQRAFERGARAEQVAEGLSYILLHRGGPIMIEACACWDEVAKELNIPGPY